MPISLTRAKEHVAKQSERLKLFQGVRHWPKFVYHAAQVEVAASILASGSLIPRAFQGALVHDVANPGAIASNPEALQFARLYFRPKTMFHLKTEGIKFNGDPNRQDAHMSVPIILAFDAVSVLTAPETGFSIGKLAGQGAQPHFDEEFFNTIPFEDVYHDSAPSKERGDEIRNHRMSEVVFRGSLPIEPHLRYVVCRTQYDRQTLLHFLGGDAQRFLSIIVPEQTLGSMFLRYCTYIKGASASDGQLKLEFAPPQRRPAAGNFTVEVRQYQAQACTFSKAYTWPADLAIGSMKDVPAAPGAIWEIQVDGSIAFKGTLPSTTSEVF